MSKWDFSGYATRNDLLCGDGRTIRKDAFIGNDGKIVPLVWNHQHNDPSAVLGHALLENREDGVYAYGSFNDSEAGKASKEALIHGDLVSLSIWANQLKQKGKDVIHGNIRELSIVLAGANPGAYVDFVMAHGDGEEDTVYADWAESDIILCHSDDKQKSKKEDEKVSETKNEPKEKSVNKILDELTEEQMDAVGFVVGYILEEAGVNIDDEEGDGNMGVVKHNVFEGEEDMITEGYLSHADQKEILDLAKSSSVGSFRAACTIYEERNSLQHDALSSGFVQTGEGNVTALFPEYKDVRPGAPELVTNDQGWISVVMSKVHKSPIARIRTRHVDIRNIQALRAKGYTKGKQKGIAGNFNLATRTTDPQTVFVKNALHRDDILDIEDFDYVQYLYNIDRMMLNEELATAIMLGDGREDGDEFKIAEDKIRPIWLDDDLYTLHVDLDLATARSELQGTGTGVSFGENYITAEAMINTVLYAREKYKGSGTPDLFLTPHMLNVMLLARDMNGRRIYSSKAELASALNVGNVYTAEQFEGKTRTDKDQNTKKLIAIIANLSDYSLGSMKGGEVTHFTQFDIDFNQQKSLLETRCSGALTRLWSAIAIEELVPPTSSDSTESEEETEGLG